VKSLAATFLAMLFVDTIGAVDPFGGRVYLPSPRVYLATFLLWGVLGIAAGFGDNAARVAGRLSSVVLLTAAVVGPFGKKAIGFLEAATRSFPAATEGTQP
jgi:hypothetical protein